MTPDEAKRAKRGTPIQTDFAHELNLHEYVWPKLLGESRVRWERVAGLVDVAARNHHAVACTSHDGRKTLAAPAFIGGHAEADKARIRHALVALLEAGIPSFLTESS